MVQSTSQTDQSQIKGETQVGEMGLKDQHKESHELIRQSGQYLAAKRPSSAMHQCIYHKARAYIQSAKIKLSYKCNRLLRTNHLGPTKYVVQRETGGNPGC